MSVNIFGWRRVSVYLCSRKATLVAANKRSIPKTQKLMKQKQKETQRLDDASSSWHTAFVWQNYALTSLALILIVAGFLLMLPPVDIRNTVGGRYAPSPGPGAFEARRIRAAPIPCFVGFVLMVPAIMYVPRESRKREENASET